MIVFIEEPPPYWDFIESVLFTPVINYLCHFILLKDYRCYAVALDPGRASTDYEETLGRQPDRGFTKTLCAQLSPRCSDRDDFEEQAGR